MEASMPGPLLQMPAPALLPQAPPAAAPRPPPLSRHHAAAVPAPQQPHQQQSPNSSGHHQPYSSPLEQQQQNFQQSQLQQQQQPQLPQQALPQASAQGTQEQPVIRKRAPIACRRCRRMRSKCQHEKARPPCRACLEAGLTAAECEFPKRGQPDQDREYRHPRVRSDKTKKRDPARSRRDVPDIPRDSLAEAAAAVKDGEEWSLLPPLSEIIEGVNRFTRHYFQLGFIPKQLFPERLRTHHERVSPFLLLGILSVSARLTPSLIERFGSAVKAAETFMDRASAVAQKEAYKDPTLERCQAFYLLSIAQQGSGYKNKSAINMAIAMRMATLMQLHREETYNIKEPSPELILRAESARRTLWMLHSQDNLHSGPRSPVLLPASDITALLPCNEVDFANARQPKSRAALEGTPPALENPALVSDPGRSLFAALIQAHQYWGIIYRRAVTHDRSPRPWEADSEFARMENRLEEWETNLPESFRWSPQLLRTYKLEGQELGYLGVTMIPRLCHIVIRKPYLSEMISCNKSDPLATFWANMAHKLFWNVMYLYEQIVTHYGERSQGEGPGAQMSVFCVYTCGFLACYLCKFPELHPDSSVSRDEVARDAANKVSRILQILRECKAFWPLASRWHDHLVNFYTSEGASAAVGEGSMADSSEQIRHVLDPATEPESTPEVEPQREREPKYEPATSSQPQRPTGMLTPDESNDGPSGRQHYRRQIQQQHHQQQQPSEMSMMAVPQRQPVADMYANPSLPATAAPTGVVPGQPPQPTPPIVSPPAVLSPHGSLPPHGPVPHSAMPPPPTTVSAAIAATSAGPRQTAGGLELLLTAFDTQHAAAMAAGPATVPLTGAPGEQLPPAVAAPPPPPPSQAPVPTPASAPQMYGPHPHPHHPAAAAAAGPYALPPAGPGPAATGPPPPPPHSAAGPPHVPVHHHAQAALAPTLNDGYENELGFYMSDGLSDASAVLAEQSWAGGAGLYGY